MMRIETFGAATIACGDWRDLIDGWDRHAAIVSDPPYGMKWNTDTTRFSGGKNGAARAGRGRKAPPIIGDDRPFDPAPFLGFREVILFGANHFGARLPVGTTLVWVKKSDRAFGTFLSDAEIAWKKGGHGVYCHREPYYPPTRRRDAGGPAHPTQKPVGLMRWCIAKTKAPEVIDPFLGSGTTAIAALREGRRFVGCEVDPAHFDLACWRLDQEMEAQAAACACA